VVAGGSAAPPVRIPRLSDQRGDLESYIFLLGMDQFHQWLARELGLRLYSKPPVVTIAQINRVVLQYLLDHPQMARKPFAQLALEALREAFPGGRREDLGSR